MMEPSPSPHQPLWLHHPTHSTSLKTWRRRSYRAWTCPALYCHSCYVDISHFYLYRGDGFLELPAHPCPTVLTPGAAAGSGRGYRLHLPPRARCQPLFIPHFSFYLAAMWAEGVAALPKSQSNRSGVKSQITAASWEWAGKKRATRGEHAVYARTAWYLVTPKSKGVGIYYRPFLEWFIFPLFQFLGVGNLSSAGMRWSETSRGLQLWQKWAPGPESCGGKNSRWRVLCTAEDPPHPPPRYLTLRTLFQLFAVLLALSAQAVTRTSRHTTVTQSLSFSSSLVWGNALIANTLAKASVLPLSPLFTEDLVMLHRQIRRLKTRLNENT